MINWIWVATKRMCSVCLHVASLSCVKIQSHSWIPASLALTIFTTTYIGVLWALFCCWCLPCSWAAMVRASYSLHSGQLLFSVMVSFHSKNKLFFCFWGLRAKLWLENKYLEYHQTLCWFRKVAAVGCPLICEHTSHGWWSRLTELSMIALSWTSPKSSYRDAGYHDAISVTLASVGMSCHSCHYYS